MADFEPRTVNFRVLAVFTLIGSMVVALILVVKAGIAHADSGTRDWSIVGAIFALTFGLGGYGLLRLLVTLESNIYHTRESLDRIVRHLVELTSELQKIREGILLSDDAKAIAFREKDSEALRQAIDEVISRKDWEAALYLAEQMEKRFGYRQEAAKLRSEIVSERKRQRSEALEELSGQFEALLASHAWSEAGTLIQTLRSQLGDAPEVSQLTEHMENARSLHKKSLLKQWDEAVQQNEIDRGIETLRELDRFQYLTPREVAALEEPARGVFRAKLHSLGVQFSLLVTEKLWDRALEVGEEIIGEFPNSRMAKEIQDGLAALREKAQTMSEDQTSTS